MILLECLLAIAGADGVRMLSSPGFQENLSESEHERVNAVCAHTLAHFGGHITLYEVASLAGMVPNSFCRYFKSRTGKTYSQFITEIRVGAACKLLIENQLSLKQFSADSGFNNASCFHQWFLEVTGKSPIAYHILLVRNANHVVQFRLCACLPEPPFLSGVATYMNMRVPE